MKTSAKTLTLALTVVLSAAPAGADNHLAAIPQSPIIIANEYKTGVEELKGDAFPNPESCPRFREELQMLYQQFVIGESGRLQWQFVTDGLVKNSDSLFAVIGEKFKHKTVQMGTASTVVVAGAIGVAYFVSVPAAVLTIVVAGGAAFFFYDRIDAARTSLDNGREWELKRVHYFDLVVKNQDYDKDMVWNEQLERFKRMAPLDNDQYIGLPTYAGGLKPYPITELKKVLKDQFSYFTLRTQLLSDAYHQLEDAPDHTSLYVHMTTARESNLTKAKLTNAMAEIDGYQSQLAVTAARALVNACGKITMPYSP